MKSAADWPPLALERLLLGPARAALLQAALETGLLSALAARGGPPASLARRAGLSAKGTELLLAGLAELGLARGHAGRWSLTPRARRLQFGPGFPGLAGALDLTCGLNWTLFPLLSRAARKGAPVVPPALAREAQLRRLAALGALAAAAGPAAAAALRRGLVRPPRRWLDIGAGTGQLSMELLRRFPRARAVLLDRPEIVRACRPGPGGAAGRRMGWRAADFNRAQGPSRWGRNYDAVLLSQVLSETADLRRLLDRAAAALRPGGVLLIHDTFAGAGGFRLALRALLTMIGSAPPRSAAEVARALRARRFQILSRSRATRWTELWVARIAT